MKLLQISLHHFRQFYGKHEFEFATSPERNVTLFHAENGVGKTTLLNAVLWAFYGETTKKFEQRQKIVNFEALQDSDYHTMFPQKMNRVLHNILQLNVPTVNLVPFCKL